MLRPALLALLLLFGASAAQAQDAPAVIGWRCAEHRQLSPNRWAFLQIPTINLDRAIPPGGFNFNLYKSLDGDSFIEASAHWNGIGDTLDDPAGTLRLYFNILGRKVSRGELIFEAEDGSRITLDGKGASGWAPSRVGTAIKVENDKLAREFLKHARYKVSLRRGSRVERLKPIDLFSLAEAVPLYAEMLAGLKHRMQDPERRCFPVHEQETDGSEIVVT
jgi:hypothetical protein